MFNYSQLEVGIGDTPLTEDDISEVYQELWKECMNCRQYEEALVTFREYIPLLHDANEGF